MQLNCQTTRPNVHKSKDKNYRDKQMHAKRLGWSQYLSIPCKGKIEKFCSILKLKHPPWNHGESETTKFQGKWNRFIKFKAVWFTARKLDGLIIPLEFSVHHMVHLKEMGKCTLQMESSFTQLMWVAIPLESQWMIIPFPTDDIPSNQTLLQRYIITKNMDCVQITISKFRGRSYTLLRPRVPEHWC